LGTVGQDLVPHPAEHLRAGGAGPELGGGRPEDLVELLVDVGHLGVGPADVGAAGVGPVAVGADADVGDHRLAGFRPGVAGDGDRAADLGGVRPGQQVGGELDRRAVGDLGGALRGGHDLDLGGARGGAVGD